jgi:ABC-type dipeptide/oligopeptide/nickel transport system permease component
MANYIIRGLVTSLVVLFLAMRLLPGDPVLVFVSSKYIQHITDEQFDQIRDEYGLDKPLPQQYISCVAGIFHGDFSLLPC